MDRLLERVAPTSLLWNFVSFATSLRHTPRQNLASPFTTWSHMTLGQFHTLLEQMHHGSID